jgi:nicotinate-nucleotide adenylyltransferase
MGEDALRDFPQWHEPSTIVHLAEVGVASRAGTYLDQRALDAVFAAVPAARGRVHCVQTPLIEISGTDIRARIHDGRPISYLVPGEVERYIIEHGLYLA